MSTAKPTTRMIHLLLIAAGLCCISCVDMEKDKAIPVCSRPYGDTMLEQFEGRYVGRLDGVTYGQHWNYVVYLHLQGDSLVYITSEHLDSVPVFIVADTVKNEIHSAYGKGNPLFLDYIDCGGRLTFSAPNAFSLSYQGVRAH